MCAEERARGQGTYTCTYEYMEEKHLDASFVCKCFGGASEVGQFVQHSHFHINPQLFTLLCIIEIDFVAQMDAHALDWMVNQLMQLR